MSSFTRSGQSLPVSFSSSSLDKLRGGPLALPGSTALRPTLVDRVFASRKDRQLMRAHDAATVTVEVAQVEAAVKVALVLTEDRTAETLKAHRVATARNHAELEAQMQQDAKDANAHDSGALNQLAIEAFEAEKQVLDTVEAKAATGRIAADRAEFLRDLARANAEGDITAGLELRDQIKQSRTDIGDRILNRKP